MWWFWKTYLSKRQWTNKKIAFVAILVATSVAFVLVFTNIAPIASVPSFKLMAGGLPIKLTGYIFGPIIGAMTGALADAISFAFRPVTWHWWYMLAWVSAGLIPGVIGFFFNRRWKNKDEISKMMNEKHNLVNFILTLIILTTVIIVVTMFVIFQPDAVFQTQKLIKNKYVFLGIAIIGSSTMLLGVVILRFVLNPQKFNAILPIIAFSALLEIIVTPLLTLGDQSTLFANTNSFIENLTGHLLFSPIKIWGNMLVIYFAYKVISPLIYNKTDNGWEK